MCSCCHLEFNNCIEEIAGGTLHFLGVVTDEVGWEHIGVQVTEARVGLLVLCVGSWVSITTSLCLLCP